MMKIIMPMPKISSLLFASFHQTMMTRNHNTASTSFRYGSHRVGGLYSLFIHILMKRKMKRPMKMVWMIINAVPGIESGVVWNVPRPPKQPPKARRIPLIGSSNLLLMLVRILQVHLRQSLSGVSGCTGLCSCRVR